MRTFRNAVIIIAVVTVVGIGINAFAHGSKGWGGGWGYHRGPQNCPGNYQGDYEGSYGGPVNSEEFKQFEQKRDAFFNETQELRSALYEKERELQNELSKENPDAAKASGLQQEISDLHAQFDQKRLDHMIEMRKLNPNAGRGPMVGGNKRGYGSKRGGCW